MKKTYLSSLFSMLSQIAGAIYTADKQKYDNTSHTIGKVGIKFDNISSGKVYPQIPVLKNTKGWKQKEVMSPL